MISPSLSPRDRGIRPRLPNAGSGPLVLSKLLPYEKPRLTTTKVQGDRNYPLFDLSALSDSELAFLRRTIRKATPIGEGSG